VVDVVAQFWLRAAAVGLALLSGFGFGAGVPVWWRDQFLQTRRQDWGNVPPDGDTSGMYVGCSTPTFGAGGPVNTRTSITTALSAILLSVALFLAFKAWPPLWLYPQEGDMLVSIGVALLQRWFFITLSAFVVGIVAGGAVYMHAKWFKQ